MVFFQITDTFNQADNNLQTVERASAEVSQFNQRFWEVDGALNSSIQIGATTLQSIVTCRNSDLEQRFRQKRESFEVNLFLCTGTLLLRRFLLGRISN